MLCRHFISIILWQDEDRKSLLRKLSDEQYKDVIRVLAMLPVLEVGTNTEVVDDEEQHVVTAGAIVTVTVTLERKYVSLFTLQPWQKRFPS